MPIACLANGQRPILLIAFTMIACVADCLFYSLLIKNYTDCFLCRLPAARYTDCFHKDYMRY